MNTTWQKSSYTNQGGGNCVETRMTGNPAVDVRDSKNPERPHLTIPAAEWVAFLKGLRDDRL